MNQLRILTSILPIGILFIALLHSTDGATLNDTKALYNDVIYNNNRKYRPIINQSDAITVQIEFGMFYLEGIDMAKEIVSLHVFLTLKWTDEIRQWNPLDYGGLAHLTLGSLDTWRPRFELVNAARPTEMFKDGYHAPQQLNNSGETVWVPSGMFETRCSIDVTWFPFDVQSCEILIGPDDSPDNIKISFLSSELNLLKYKQNGEWKLTKSWMFYNDSTSSHSVSFRIEFTRRPAYVILNVIVPITFLSLLSHLAFLVPVESGERLSFAITIMLSMTVWISQISSSFPRNSNSLPLVSIYLVVMFIHCGINLIATGLILSKHHSTAKRHKNIDGNNSNDNNGIDPRPIQTNNISRDYTNPNPRYHPGYTQPLPSSSSTTVHRTPTRTANSPSPPRGNRVSDASSNSSNSSGDSSHPCRKNKPRPLSSCREYLTQYISHVDLCLFCSTITFWMVCTLLLFIITKAGY